MAVRPNHYGGTPTSASLVGVLSRNRRLPQRLHTLGHEAEPRLQGAVQTGMQVRTFDSPGQKRGRERRSKNIDGPGPGSGRRSDFTGSTRGKMRWVVASRRFTLGCVLSGWESVGMHRLAGHVLARAMLPTQGRIPQSGGAAFA
eukprot:253837-Chlamydomonas_euryale.AAC.1